MSDKRLLKKLLKEERNVNVSECLPMFANLIEDLFDDALEMTKLRYPELNARSRIPHQGLINLILLFGKTRYYANLNEIRSSWEITNHAKPKHLVKSESREFQESLINSVSLFNTRLNTHDMADMKNRRRKFR